MNGILERLSEVKAEIVFYSSKSVLSEKDKTHLKRLEIKKKSLEDKSEAKHANQTN